MVGLLSRMAREFPQALYHTLRTAHFELKSLLGSRGSSTREIENVTPTGSKRHNEDEGEQSTKRGRHDPDLGSDQSHEKSTPTSASTGPSSITLAKAHLSQITQAFRGKYAVMFTLLEAMAEEFIHKFRSSATESALRHVHLLLIATLNNAFQTLSKADVGQEDVTPLIKALVAVMQSAPPHDRLSKHKEKLLTDLREVSQARPIDAVPTLRHWHQTLSAEVEEMPRSLRLDDVSPLLGHLSAIPGADLFLPSEHLFQRNFVNAANYHRIERILPRVDIVHNARSPDRRIYIRTRTGHIFPFLIQNTALQAIPQPHQRSEERLHHLMRLMNDMLEQRKESRRRGLQYQLVRMVPLAQNVRFVHEEQSSVSLHDVFSNFCSERGTDVLDPILFYLAKRREYEQQPQQPGRDIGKELFEEIRRTQVPATILTDYIRRVIPDYASYWAFRTNFTRQLSFISFATRILYLNHGAPHTVNFHLASGGVVYSELYPNYEDGVVANFDHVVFRLTPNLVRFMSNEGTTGAFAVSLMTSAQVINDPEFRAHDFLAAFFRDELIAQHMKSSTSRQIENSDLVSKVAENVTHVTDRLNNLATVDGQLHLTNSLIHNATTSSNLAVMPPTWHPWL